MSIKAE